MNSDTGYREVKMSLSRIAIMLICVSARSAGAEGVVDGFGNDTGDGFWTNLVRECNQQPTLSCVTDNVYKYLDATLQSKTVDVGGVLKFTKNDYIDNSSEARDTPVEESLQPLHDKAMKFFFSHDIQLILPDFLVGGGVLKVSPRASQTSGVLLKVDMEPKKDNKAADPRIFKKIKQYFSGKLTMALLAIALVIKLLAMKLMFFLPTIMGIAAAKKLLLKVLLFVFPFLSHLFKLCPYYQPTKYHHHHHQISHHHQLGHLGHASAHLSGHGGGHHIPYLQGSHGVELDHPPPGWNEQSHHDELGYYADGPGFGADFVNHRKNIELGKPARRTEDAYKDNGQGQPALGHRVQETKPPTKLKTGPLTAAEIENMVLKAEKEAILKARLQEEQKRVEGENKRIQDQIKSALKLQEKLKIQSMVAKQTSKIAVAYHAPNLIQPQLIQPQIVHAVPQTQAFLPQHMIQSIPQTQAFYHQNIQRQDTTASPPIYQTPRPTMSTYDPFYSPLLEKIDKVLIELSFYEEPCRERLICSMYKNPTKFTPHSNHISAELSRDASELQKPTSSNQAVIRFYKYVQAARDGQDKRDCLRLYPSCSVITE